MRGVKKIVKSENWNDEHLAQAQIMLKNIDYFYKTTDEQAIAGAAGDDTTVEFWRLCYVALADIWDWRKAGIKRDKNAYHTMCNIGNFASGHRELTEEELEKELAYYNDVLNPQWEAEMEKEKNTPTPPSYCPIEDEIPF